MHNSGDLLNNQYRLLILKKWKVATEECFPNLDMFKEIDIQSKFWVNLSVVQWMGQKNLLFNVYKIWLQLTKGATITGC